MCNAHETSKWFKAQDHFWSHFTYASEPSNPRAYMNPKYTEVS